MGQAVVIVEDNAWQAQFLERELSRAGLECHVADSAFVAIDLIDEVQPGAILLDIGLPASNGIALIHELKSHQDLAAIPVVVCSNMASELPDDFAADYNVAAVVDKATIEPGELAAKLKGLVSGWS